MNSNVTLNHAQQEAVQTIDGPILILAGAGSGKTKTITSRLAYLLSIGIDPASTLTLTFTNKAATQMRERALRELDTATIYPPLLCTFHKFGLLFLKFNMHKLGRNNNFAIIDTDDKKRILKSFEIDLPVSLVATEISKYKNSLTTPQSAVASAIMENYKKIAKYYMQYEEYLEENNLVDFDDLLSLTYKILDNDPELAATTSNRYRYIMVDEYQDTNDLQYRLLKKLCSAHNNICVVGDDDQSIYGWRGANIENILNFGDEFEDAKIIKLEENYRSTEKILNTANELIEHNRSRLGKRLKTTKGSGEEVAFEEFQNENDEASHIAKSIKKLLAKGVNSKEIAVLYRINALSRSLEEGLNREGVAYKMIGGIKFYERAEIKDIVSYLRLLINPHDDFSMRRVINRPKRGLGKVTLTKLEQAAYAHRCSLYAYIKNHHNELEPLVGKKNAKTLFEFADDIDTLNHKLEESTYSLIDELESTFGIKNYYASLPDGIERAANIDEFYGLLRDQVKNNPEMNIDDILNEIALQSDQDSIDADCINIMSIHASKGLEFEHLYVIGLEDGFFPLLGDGCDIEEERRLGYVAITRAKSNLTLSSSQSRYYKGRRSTLTKSRFLKECGVCEGSLQIEKSQNFKKGDLVRHKIFGVGRVLAVSRAGKEFKLSINFGGITRDILSSFVHTA
jgi:DNA helicase-2/ATP-dependent DNA helicase PcrA